MILVSSEYVLHVDSFVQDILIMLLLLSSQEFHEEHDIDFERVWQPNSLWAQRTQRVNVPGTYHIIDTVDMLLPIHDFRDGTETNQLVRGYLVEHGTAFAFKMPAVPLYFIDMATQLHNHIRKKSNDAFLTEHKCAATAKANGEHFKWVKYNLPSGVRCTTDYFNNSDGSLAAEFNMVNQDLPFKDKTTGKGVATLLPFLVFNVAISGPAKMMQRPEAATVSQLTDAFEHILGNMK
jgi:hypothetical protein